MKKEELVVMLIPLLECSIKSVQHRSANDLAILKNVGIDGGCL